MTTIPLDPSLLKIKPAVQPASAPTAATGSPAPSGSGWIQTLLLIAAIAVGFLWLGSRNGGSDGPVPPTPASVVQISERATLQYAAFIGDAMDMLAASVDEGKITNAEQLKNNSQSLTKTAREKSFATIDQIDTDNIPAGDWTAEQRTAVAVYLRAKAQGHRKASK